MSSMGASNNNRGGSEFTDYIVEQVTSISYVY